MAKPRSTAATMNAALKALVKVVATKKNNKLAPITESLSTALGKLQSWTPESTIASVNLLQKTLVPLFSTDILPLYFAHPSQLLSVISATITTIYGMQISTYLSRHSLDARAQEEQKIWEEVLECGVLEGVLNYMDKKGSSGRKLVGDKLYLVLCPILYQSSENLSALVRRQICAVLTDSARNEKANKANLLDATVLGATRIGEILAKAKDFHYIEATMELVARLNPRKSDISQRTSFARNLFLNSTAVATFGKLNAKRFAEYLVDGDDEKWYQTAALLQKEMAIEDIDRPQLFEVSELVVDARVIPLPNHMRHIHISQTAFLSAVPDDEGEGVLETVEITFLSIAQVALSAAASGDNVHVRLSLFGPPPHPFKQDPASGGDKCQVIFDIAKADLDRLRQVIQARSLHMKLQDRVRIRNSSQPRKTSHPDTEIFHGGPSVDLVALTNLTKSQAPAAVRLVQVFPRDNPSPSSPTTLATPNGTIPHNLKIAKPSIDREISLQSLRQQLFSAQIELDLSDLSDAPREPVLPTTHLARNVNLVSSPASPSKSAQNNRDNCVPQTPTAPRKPTGVLKPQHLSLRSTPVRGNKRKKDEEGNESPSPIGVWNEDPRSKRRRQQKDTSRPNEPWTTQAKILAPKPPGTVARQALATMKRTSQFKSSKIIANSKPTEGHLPVKTVNGPSRGDPFIEDERPEVPGTSNSSKATKLTNNKAQHHPGNETDIRIETETQIIQNNSTLDPPSVVRPSASRLKAIPKDTKSDAAPWLQEPDAQSAPEKPSLNASSIPSAVFSATPVNATRSISARRPKEPRSKSTEHLRSVGDKDHALSSLDVGGDPSSSSPTGEVTMVADDVNTTEDTESRKRNVTFDVNDTHDIFTGTGRLFVNNFSPIRLSQRRIKVQASRDSKSPAAAATNLAFSNCRLPPRQNVHRELPRKNSTATPVVEDTDHDLVQICQVIQDISNHITQSVRTSFDGVDAQIRASRDSILQIARADIQDIYERTRTNHDRRRQFDVQVASAHDKLQEQLAGVRRGEAQLGSLLNQAIRTHDSHVSTWTKQRSRAFLDAMDID